MGIQTKKQKNKIDYRNYVIMVITGISVCCYRKIKLISKHPTHPLFLHIKRSARTERIQLDLAHTEHEKASFVQNAITFFTRKKINLY